MDPELLVMGDVAVFNLGFQTKQRNGLLGGMIANPTTAEVGHGHEQFGRTFPGKDCQVFCFLDISSAKSQAAIGL